MDITIQPGLLSGKIPAVPSKSQAHRLLICAAFAHAPTVLTCPDSNQDIDATVRCLRALGAEITRREDGFLVVPVRAVPGTAALDCGESGSTLRFLLPIAGALGVNATFRLAGRLPQRPLSPLWEEMERMGCCLSRPSADTILCTGQLSPGDYSISGSVSSQFITGMLFALMLLPGQSTLTVTGKVESAPYIRMTLSAMDAFGVRVPQENLRFTVTSQALRSPGTLQVEGDWSNAAFWLAANALGSRVTITGLNEASAQGDKKIGDFLRQLESPAVIDAGQTPDLIPVLAAAAGAKAGAVFTNAGRLRLKESDRLLTTAAMLRSLGGCAQIRGNELIVSGGGYRGGTVDAAGDHRIAMAAAIAATVCTEPVTILGAEAVTKSYPHFWADYRRAGGNYEQHFR